MENDFKVLMQAYGTDRAFTGLIADSIKANIEGYGGEEDFYEISPSTKIISHSAQIAPGSSGGPLFDKNGYLIGLNTFMDSSFNYSVSADHIKELLKK